MKRRLFAHGVASAGLAFAGCGGAKEAAPAALPESSTTPTHRMPDEGERHAKTWMAFAGSRDIWGSDLPAVQQDLIRIANAIAAFEPVSMLVNADARATAAALLANASQRAQITLVDASLDDLWMRDTGPVFARRLSDGALQAVDFNFNGWGNKQAHARDATVAAQVSLLSGTQAVKSQRVLEGGAIEVDGEGTALVKESCTLNANRNPGVSKATIELELRHLLGVQKVLWLPGPAGGDITDAHTDFYARFAGGGVVVVSHDANDAYGERAVTQRHIDVLRSATDAAGRALRLEVINVPDAPSSARANDASFAAGYINYYLCNGALVMPRFGDASADAAAQQTLARLYPTRRVVPITIDGIAAGGGGIHCTTQQEPSR